MKQQLIDRLGRVAVFYGGTSAEREVSLNSGKAVVDALKRAGVDVLPVEVNEGTMNEFEADFCDRVFLALHGRGGEDGTIQGYLDTLGVPYTGSGVLASSLAMDKIRTKLIWLSRGLPTPDFAMLTSGNLLDNYQRLGPVVCVKPAHEGSSIGVEKVCDTDEMKKAFSQAEKFDQEVMAETWVQGREFTVAILDGQALPVIGLSTDHTLYDYQAKYVSDDTRYQLPAGLGESEERDMQRLSLEAFEAVGCEGWGRVDVMQDEQGKSWLLEVNTIPGMTDHSLVPMAAAHQGISFDALVLKILESTLP
ncbi:MAG: D-alanine--D-alanine ligase [Proteobacteria bacterium]|nr:MAG: D-alanine--D-alanine ligase [Pseudomonadota bacterium]